MQTAATRIIPVHKCYIMYVIRRPETRLQHHAVYRTQQRKPARQSNISINVSSSLIGLWYVSNTNDTNRNVVGPVHRLVQYKRAAVVV